MTSSRCPRAALLSILILLSAGPSLAAGEAESGNSPVNAETDSASPTVVNVLPARSFGFTLGDVLLQNIALPDGFQNTDLSRLSDTDRVSTWLERQDAVINTTSDHAQTLTVRYQIVNSPSSIIKAALPELSLAASSGGDEPAMIIPAWPFTLGPVTIATPLTDADAPVDTRPMVNGVPLQSDMTLPALDVATPAARLHLMLLLFSLMLVAWAGWYLWRCQRDKIRLPFAQASHALGLRKPRKQTDTDQSWKTLHRAFNQSAGHVVNASSIDALLNQHDWLRPLENRIKAFFDASAARHFAIPARDEPFAIEALARELAHCEISNSR